MLILPGQIFSQGDASRVACDSLYQNRCELLVCLSNGRHFAEAYRYLLRNEMANCSGAEVQWARIKVLGANRKYQEARLLLDELRDLYPNEGKYYTENARLDQMELMENYVLPAVVTPLASANSVYNELLAWLENDVPVILSDHPKFAAYFPARKESRIGYDFVSTRDEQPQADWHSSLRKLGFEQLGPGQIISDSILFFTGVREARYDRKSDTRKLEIFEFNLKNKKLKSLPEPINMDGANNAYPCFMPSTGRLIFSSDRPGGRGGMDLWESTLKAGHWSGPKPLPYFINTPSQELFPFVKADTLYYSSNRPEMGFGGMDVYAVDLNSGKQWNMGEPINTPYDDFRLTFVSQEEAYFVSNRPYGTGADDIYHVRWAAAELFFEEITGVAAWPPEAIGEEVHLVDTDHNILQSSVIDVDGKFRFYNVKGYENYEIVLPDVNIPDGLSLDILNSKGRLIKTVTSDLKGSFQLELLDPLDFFIDVITNEDESILDIDIRGAVIPPRGGLRLVLLDSAGVTIGTSYTTADGKFIFESVKPDNTYQIRSEVLNVNDTIHILNGKGQILNSISPGTSKDYIFMRLGTDDRVITLTNEFQQKVRISDTEVFELGRVYFDWDAFDISETGKQALLKLIAVLKVNPHVMVELSGHTDSRGSDSYNIKLSQYRIDSVIRFLELGGIDRKRMSGTGYGEKHLRNHCSDGVECTEEQHAQNRRTEFKIIENSNPQINDSNSK